jgi:superfamily II DNA helicase RecQ
MSDSRYHPQSRLYLQRCSEFASYYMKEVFGTTPYPWQLQVMAHLCCMGIPDSKIDPAPVLLVRPTGGGKSSVRDVYSIMNGGFSLTITPLLSLGADQESKITLKARQTTGNVISVHLDEIRSPADQNTLVTMLKAIPPDGHTTVLLFSSPQAILNKDFPWSAFIDWMILNNRLTMVCVDEVHLFVHFGLTFRDEFKGLTPALFDKLKVPGSTTKTTIPFLFMTGTCSKTIVSSLQRLIGIQFDTSRNVFWPGADEMQHRNVLFEVVYTTQVLKVFKKKVGPHLKRSTIEKFIVYTNTRVAVERLSTKICDWIDLEGHRADILQIVGTLLREQKFYHIRVFTRSNALNADVLVASETDDRPACLEVDRPFNPQILVATSGAANAGLDDPEVHGVLRYDFPPSIIDAQQEKGRAGRRHHANSATDWYLLCLSLESYVILLKRLHNNPSARNDNSYFKTLESDIHDCLLAFVIPQQCYHAYLEMKLANPYDSSPLRPMNCLDSCSYCLGSPIFPSISKDGVRTVLMQIFLGQSQMRSRPILDKDLVDGIKNFDGSNRLIFGTNTNKKPEPVLVKKLILMLLAARILEYVIDRKETSPGKFEVTVVGALAFVTGDATRLAMNDDAQWSLLPLKA